MEHPPKTPDKRLTGRSVMSDFDQGSSRPLFSEGTPLSVCEPEGDSFYDSSDSVRPTARLLAVVIICIAALLLFSGAWIIPAMSRQEKVAGYVAPEGSPSLLAEKKLEKHFPVIAKIGAAQVVMVIEAKEGFDTVLTPAVEAFSRNVSRMVRTDSRTVSMFPSVVGYYIGGIQVGLPPRAYILEQGYLSPDRKMTVIVFMATRPPPPEDGKVLSSWQITARIMSFMRDLEAYPPEGATVRITGNPAISYDNMNDRSISMLEGAELHILPLAMLVMAYIIRDPRLLLIPPLALAVTFVTACLFVIPVSWICPYFTADIPPCMGSLTMALSLDYSLFLLTRFNENVAVRLNLQDNIDSIIAHTCRTITVSGLLITVAFCGAVTMPEKNLQAAGLALGATTLANLLVNATLTPAILLIIGPFLERTEYLLDMCPGGKPGRSAGRAGLQATRPLSLGGFPAIEGCDERASFWFRVIRCVERCPRAAVLMVFIVFAPILMQLPKLRTTATPYAMLPDNLESLQGLRALDREKFPAGRYEPYFLLFETDNPLNVEEGYFATASGMNSPILTEASFDAMLGFCERAKKEIGGISGFLGFVYMIDQQMPFKRAERLSKPQNMSQLSVKDSRWKHLYASVLSSHVKGNAALIQVHTEFLPRGSGAGDWVFHFRDLMEDWMSTHPGLYVSLTGGASVPADIRKAVIDAMPMYMGVSVFFIMLLVLGLFRSILLPLRLAFALCFTLGATFGIATLVYQSRLLWGVFPFLAHYDGLTFQAVPIATCICVALGLDYDIFLISRIVELRKAGYSDRDSIVHGVAKSGAIISGAGLIMALAFSGLFFAPKLFYQQFALLLVSSVLLDTFVVRTVLVPALMLAAEGWNWWPAQMPEPNGSSPFVPLAAVGVEDYAEAFGSRAMKRAEYAETSNDV